MQLWDCDADRSLAGLRLQSVRLLSMGCREVEDEILSFFKLDLSFVRGLK